MTTIPDVGLEARGDLVRNAVAYVALGTGQNEATDATALASPAYGAAASNANVELVETTDTGGFEVVIRVKGGTEVAGGTAISEMAVYDGDPEAGGTLLTIDEFEPVTVEAGHTEEFTIPHDPSR
ncbi:hypothetical protein J2752_000471 [Halarchaeum rubridurum]|uniref:Uncharacterized protein n=1 Tax=Halarchaeum rubridurum TaxID=489911 RepID=A0A830FND2_9EURY|nr:hypothetical protein [Halarchaeum rubridurum]MBP1953590.1 hypothetical protein [Halarchaeum rubridurum]GGM64134.1 hypothetical protein GCM10009017_12730 [Halarchaeum rubridurum]